MRNFVQTILILIALASLDGSVHAGDWPQILGPHRDGVADGEKLADSWPEAGPPVVWQKAVGSGFAGIAVLDGAAILFHRVDDREVVEALDARTGTPLWKKDFPAEFRPTFIDDDGPRCVPLIHDGFVYVLGARGGLHCLELVTGRLQWTRDLYQDYLADDRTLRGGEPREGYFGVGSTPIIEGDKLVLNIGGAGQNASIVALALDTGKTLWTAVSDRASYSAPVAATVDGVRHLIFVTRLSLVSLDPENGHVRFELPFGKTGPTVNAASPIVMGDHVFVTASYGVGALWAQIEKDNARPVWQRDDILSSQYATGVPHAGLLFGIHGRQDIGTAALRCIDPAEPKVRWSKPDFGTATLILADGKLLCLTTRGELVLARPNPDRYQELDRAKILLNTSVRGRDNAARALPALSNGYLYARDAAVLKCLDLRPGS